MEHWNKSLNFIFPTKYVIPKSLKFSHWPSKYNPLYNPTKPGFFIIAQLKSVKKSEGLLPTLRKNPAKS